MYRKYKCREGHDYMDVGGRVTSGTVTEDVQDDCMDAGGRATPGAVAEGRARLKIWCLFIV